jgi:hypothetical protein
MRWSLTNPDEIDAAGMALTNLLTAALEESLELVAIPEADAGAGDLLAFLELAGDLARVLARLRP